MYTLGVSEEVIVCPAIGFPSVVTQTLVLLEISWRLKCGDDSQSVFCCCFSHWFAC